MNEYQIGLEYQASRIRTSSKDQTQGFTIKGKHSKVQSQRDYSKIQYQGKT